MTTKVTDLAGNWSRSVREDFCGIVGADGVMHVTFREAAFYRRYFVFTLAV